MIQRIQTVLLFLAAAVNFPVLFLNLGDASSNATMESPSAHLYGSYIQKEWLSEADFKFVSEKIGPGDNTLMLVHVGLLGLSCLLLLGNIFMYNNRPRQAMLAYLGVLLIMGQLVVAVMLFMKLPEMIGAAEGDPHDVGFFMGLPVIAMGLAWFAAKRIQRDEKMVRDMDRIR